MKQRIRINENHLKQIVSESIKKVLKEIDYDEDYFNELVSQYDEEGTIFRVQQYRFIMDAPTHIHYETIVDENGLTKEEAWNIFKEAAIRAYEYDYKVVSPYGSTKEYIELPIVSTKISTIYGNTGTKFPTTDTKEIIHTIMWHKRENDDVSWKEMCQDFLKKAKDSFFSGKYEYTSY